MPFSHSSAFWLRSNENDAFHHEVVRKVPVYMQIFEPCVHCSFHLKFQILAQCLFYCWFNCDKLYACLIFSIFLKTCLILPYDLHHSILHIKMHGDTNQTSRTDQGHLNLVRRSTDCYYIGRCLVVH